MRRAWTACEYTSSHPGVLVGAFALAVVLAAWGRRSLAQITEVALP
ncbi:hypothetical protein PZ938_10210 [Luteipulveratus sp. YIM 133132]|nr:hypothetical protein [Luteipulveratus sp. YIM 133132]MDE9365976.1 hypothetical protein [Luteipulveratus sp. YIM 133132]